MPDYWYVSFIKKIVDINIKDNILEIQKSRGNLYFFLISILSFIVVLFHIINLDARLGISNIFYLNSLFQLIVLISTIFMVTLLPSYPIFFVVFRDKEFNLLEKLNLTIVLNLAF